MKVAVFIENYVAGGSDKIARDLLDNLKCEDVYFFTNKRNDFNVILKNELPENVHLIKYSIFTLAEMGALANSIKRKNKVIGYLFKIFNLIIRYPLMLFYIAYFYFIFRRYPIDTFFSNNGGYPGGECNRMATFSAAFLGLKNYHVVHNLATYPFMKLVEPIERVIDRSLSKRTNFICVSNQTKEYLLNRRDIRSEPIVIYNGVKKYSCSVKELINSGNINLLSIGALGERKNQLLILEALKILKNKEILGFKLTLVGQEEDEGYLQRLKDKASEYGLENNISYEGFQSDVYPYYQKNDVFILSSVVESFALVRVEAMSVGMPIITTDVGDAGYQVENNKNGFIVNNSDELAIAIERYLSDYQLIIEHAKNGFQVYNKKFTIDKMISKYQELLVVGD